MEIFIYTYLFIIGASLASFLGVVGNRLPKGESIINPKRSYCDNCRTPLKFIDMIPIFSYIFTLGKCRYCKEKISFFYPIMELLTGILFMVNYHIFGFNCNFFIGIILISYLMVVVISDINYLIIPDEVTLCAVILVFIVEIFGFGIMDALIHLLYGMLMFVSMYLLMLLGNLLFKKESLGGGDIKLMFLVGLSLNPFASLFVIFLSSLIALPISIILFKINREHVIPYGPFLSLALLLSFFFQINIDKFMMILN